MSVAEISGGQPHGGETERWEISHIFSLGHVNPRVKASVPYSQWQAEGKANMSQMALPGLCTRHEKLQLGHLGGSVG